MKRYYYNKFMDLSEEMGTSLFIAMEKVSYLDFTFRPGYVYGVDDRGVFASSGWESEGEYMIYRRKNGEWEGQWEGDEEIVSLMQMSRYWREVFSEAETVSFYLGDDVFHTGDVKLVSFWGGDYGKEYCGYYDAGGVLLDMAGMPIIIDLYDHGNSLSYSQVKFVVRIGEDNKAYGWEFHEDELHTAAMETVLSAVMGDVSEIEDLALDAVRLANGF